ncbi:hypothetical protein [Sphingobacterium siyangense]|uniref:hypothetical protein n=1 Tax=Sphingobacterium siyangense TaxID=459529 RepID=UPI0019653D56|nr:hypothetical protein [Sphingobacterium siyangense]QRY58273.1 hypothetical protein JVX97_02010 [Sphingobacterium siyangense]
MKLSTLKKANWIVAAVLLTTSGTLITSCSKDKNTAIEQSDDHEGTNLVLSISGINESNDDIKQASAASKENRLNVQSFSDVDVVSSVETNTPYTPASELAVKSYSSSGQVAASNTNLRAAALGDGVKYRLYLLSADGTQVLSSQQYTVSSATPTGTITVTPGTTYKWVAFSYNNTEDITAITTANPTVTVDNKDLLYASGNITIPNTPGVDVSLPILFEHKFSRIGIRLNTMGVFGPITSVGTIGLSNVSKKTATINVATGAFTPATTSTAVTSLSLSDFTNVTPGFADDKIAYIYTAGTDQLTGVSVSLSNVAIKHSDNVDRTFGSTTAITISYGNITPALGHSRVLLANVVESPLTVGSGASAVKFARSNLYYTAGHNPYRFFAENKQRSDANSYFAYGATTPAKFVNLADRADPCALVYPANLWREATHADLAVLTTGNDLLNGLLSSLGSLNIALTPDAPAGSTPGKTGTAFNYAQYTTTAGSGNPAFDAASNSLRFYYNGQLARLNVLPTNFLTLDVSAVQTLLGGSYGQQAALWAKDAPGNILGLINLGTWGYLASTERLGVDVFGVTVAVPNSEYVKAKGSAELLQTVSLLGIDVLSSSLKNVRCVRN